MQTQAPAPSSLLQGRRPLPLLEACFEAHPLEQRDRPLDRLERGPQLEALLAERETLRPGAGA